MNSDALGLERRLIFQNFANGVDPEAMKSIFKRSAAEIEREIVFVAKKIKEYRFRRCAEGSKFAAPPIACDSLTDIRLNRLALLETLSKLGDLYLSSELLLPKVIIQSVSTGSDLAAASHRMRA